MDMSAVSLRKAAPSSFFPPFSDQSHLQFYGRGRSSFLVPSYRPCKVPSCRSSAFNSVIVPVQAFSDSFLTAATEPTSEEALLKELAELKLRMKQKKKELKAQIKEGKKKMKEERKRKKQKGDVDGKLKMKCYSESSTSSESCDEECTSVSMKMMKQSQAIIEKAREISKEGFALDKCAASCDAVSALMADISSHTKETVFDVDEFESRALLSGGDAAEASSGKPPMALTVEESSELFLNIGTMGTINSLSKKGEMSICKSKVDGGLGVSPRPPPPLRAANRIEVCAGGKCKKAGSQQLLAALQAQIPLLANVEAVPCKCMGKCSMAVNVRVLKEDTNPQHHSHVGMEDGPLILSHHFGVGCPPAGLPSLSPGDVMRKSLPLVAT